MVTAIGSYYLQKSVKIGFDTRSERNAYDFFFKLLLTLTLLTLHYFIVYLKTKSHSKICQLTLVRFGFIIAFIRQYIVIHIVEILKMFSY